MYKNSLFFVTLLFIGIGSGCDKEETEDSSISLVSKTFIPVTLSSSACTSDSDNFTTSYDAEGCDSDGNCQTMTFTSDSTGVVNLSGTVSAQLPMTYTLNGADLEICITFVDELCQKGTVSSDGNSLTIKDTDSSTGCTNEGMYVLQ